MRTCPLSSVCVSGMVDVRTSGVFPPAGFFLNVTHGAPARTSRSISANARGAVACSVVPDGVLICQTSAMCGKKLRTVVMGRKGIADVLRAIRKVVDVVQVAERSRRVKSGLPAMLPERTGMAVDPILLELQGRSSVAGDGCRGQHALDELREARVQAGRDREGSSVARNGNRWAHVSGIVMR